MPSNRQASVRRSQGAVALARARLRRRGGVRIARASAWLLAIGCGAAAVALRAHDGPDVSLVGLVSVAAHGIAWISGAPIALAAAEDHRAADRREGVLSLAAARGVSSSGLAAARVLGAMAEIATAIGGPLVALSLLTAGLAGRAAAAAHGIGIALGVALFALVAGVTLGGIGAACGRAGGGRGRWLLAAIVIGPWVLADLAGNSALSIPGALNAALDFALRARSAGA